MSVLEKILEEIDNRKSYHEEKLYQQDDYEIQKMYCDEELNWVRDTICSHMNEFTNGDRENGCHVYEVDSNAMKDVKPVSREFLEECAEVARKYRKNTD